MLLVVDVGNTQTHFGAFRGEELLEHWRFATVRQSTADELGAALRKLLGRRRYGVGGGLPPGASPPPASRRPTSSARPCATCWGCAATASRTWSRRSSPRPFR